MSADSKTDWPRPGISFGVPTAMRTKTIIANVITQLVRMELVTGSPMKLFSEAAAS